MQEKTNPIFFAVFFLAGIIGLFYGYSQFVGPYILKKPGKLGGPKTEQKSPQVLPLKWQKHEIKIPSTYPPRSLRKSKILDLY